MTIGGVPPLINKPWFINPGLTLPLKVYFESFKMCIGKEPQVDGKITVQENKFNITLNISKSCSRTKTTKATLKTISPCLLLSPVDGSSGLKHHKPGQVRIGWTEQAGSFDHWLCKCSWKIPSRRQSFFAGRPEYSIIFGDIKWFKHIESRISRGFFVKSMEWNWSQNHNHDSDDGYAISPRFFFGNQLDQQKRLSKNCACLKLPF